MHLVELIQVVKFARLHLFRLEVLNSNLKNKTSKKRREKKLFPWGEDPRAPCTRLPLFHTLECLHFLALIHGLVNSCDLLVFRIKS